MPSLEKYKIKSLESDELKPEETLADTLSIYPVMEMPIGRRVFGVFYLVVAVIFLFIVFKSFQLQVISGEELALSAELSSSLHYQLSHLRGLIYDSQNRPMVENAPVFDLVAVHLFLPESAEELAGIISRLAETINEDEESLKEIFRDNQDQAVFLVRGN